MRPKIHLVTYANYAFAFQRNLLRLSAYSLGGITSHLSFDPMSIDDEFRSANRSILSTLKGAGLWLWKPYVILRSLESIQYGEYLFYCDSGSLILRSPAPLIKKMEHLSQDIGLFELPLIEKQWTKKNVFKFFGVCDTHEFANTNQVSASFQLIKKTDFSLLFYSRYLNICQIESLIDDSLMPQDKNSFFIENRHDQSILSLLSKTYKIRPFADISQLQYFPQAYAGAPPSRYKNDIIYLYGDIAFRTNSQTAGCGLIVFHSRRRNQPTAIILFVLRFVLSSLNIYKGLVY